VKSDFESLRSRHDNNKSKLDSYLEGSVKLRSFDKDQLGELVTQICKLDIEQDNDDAERIAHDSRDRAITVRNLPGTGCIFTVDLRRSILTGVSRPSPG
jgi:hypothetical protein